MIEWQHFDQYINIHLLRRTSFIFVMFNCFSSFGPSKLQFFTNAFFPNIGGLQHLQRRLHRHCQQAPLQSQRHLQTRKSSVNVCITQRHPFLFQFSTKILRSKNSTPLHFCFGLVCAAPCAAIKAPALFVFAARLPRQPCSLSFQPRALCSLFTRPLLTRFSSPSSPSPSSSACSSTSSTSSHQSAASTDKSVARHSTSSPFEI